MFIPINILRTLEKAEADPNLQSNATKKHDAF
jgi:hypothetical protein